jgi:hypothetical protein
VVWGKREGESIFGECVGSGSRCVEAVLRKKGVFNGYLAFWGLQEVFGFETA